MAVISRPGKEGNATTYQGKVAAGYTSILAQEVDADFDAIYSAWNAGVDSVNIKPGAVGPAQLAPNSVTPNALAPNAVTPAALAPNAVTTPAIADANVTPSKLAPGVIGAGSGWVDDTVSVVHLNTPTRNVGVGTAAPSGKLHVQGQPTDLYCRLNVENTNSSGNDTGLALMTPGGQGTVLYVDVPNNRFHVFDAKRGADVLSVDLANAYVYQVGADLQSRLAGAYIDTTYSSGGPNSTAAFTVKSITIAAWAVGARGYRVRFAGTVGHAAGGIDFSLLVGPTTIAYLNFPAPGWTLAYYVIEADILTAGGNMVFNAVLNITSTPVQGAPTVTAADTYVIRGTGTLPAAPSSINLGGRFSAAAAGNAIDCFTTVMTAL